MISPAEFIPVAEEIGLIVPIGEWVLSDQACADAAPGRTDVKVAVNLSPIQVMNQNLVAVVVSALAGAGLPARPAGDRDHRVGADAEHRDHAGDAASAARARASASRWTISAPATRR